MEIYYIYNFFSQAIFFFNGNPIASFIWGAGVALLVWLALFILQGFGLYTMARNLGLRNKACAFIPFVNLLYLGQIVGECFIFNQRVKRAGLYAMIAQIACTLLNFMMIFAELFLFAKYGIPQNTEMMPFWSNLSAGFDTVVYDFYKISYFLVALVSLPQSIFLLILLIGLCKKYAPKNHMILSWLGILVPVSRYIIIFALRNKTAIDYNEYMRRRREQYYQQQQRYNPYQNPYQNNNPYQNTRRYDNHNPYEGQYSNNNGPTAPPEEPFAEFSSSNSRNTSGSERSQNTQNTQNPSGDGDDFFS